ncbi:MAG: tetratricopeptide repeat protein [Acaryochloridaceae cyanobacterium RU_4_10]|nr:tetratricopeptide repeat protein [Acaryochloridaceae cyanobacterium RU_4_10]
MFQQSLITSQGISDHNSRANSLIGLGAAHRLLGQHTQAIEYYEKALAITREIGDRNGEAKSLNGLGNVSNSIGQYPRRLSTWRNPWLLHARSAIATVKPFPLGIWAVCPLP